MTEEMGVFFGIIVFVVGLFMFVGLVTADGARNESEKNAGYGCFNFSYAVLAILALLFALTAIFGSGA